MNEELNNFKANISTIVNYNRAIELKPDYAEAYYGRGHAYAFSYYEQRVDAETDNSNRAMSDYNRALKLKADYLPALQGREQLESKINCVNRPSSAQVIVTSDRTNGFKDIVILYLGGENILLKYSLFEKVYVKAKQYTKNFKVKGTAYLVCGKSFELSK